MKIDTRNVDKFIDSFQLETYKKRKDEIYNLLDCEKMNGWLEPDLSCLNDIFRVRDRVVNNSRCLVVVGIGGSFLGKYHFLQRRSYAKLWADFPLRSVRPKLV